MAAPLDLTNPEERKAISPAARQGFLKIADCWHLQEDDARRLLGLPTAEEYAALKAEEKPVLSQDALERISYVLGMFKNLHIALNPPLADEWMQRKNRNPLFEERTPLAYILEAPDQKEACREVRGLLELHALDQDTEPYVTALKRAHQVSATRASGNSAITRA